MGSRLREDAAILASSSSTFADGVNLAGLARNTRGHTGAELRRFVRRHGDAGCAAARNVLAIRGRQTTSTLATPTLNCVRHIVRATLPVQIVAGQNDGGFYRGGVSGNYS